MRTGLGAILILAGLLMGLVGFGTYQQATVSLAEYQKIGNIGGGVGSAVLNVVPQTRAAMERAYRVQGTGIATMGAGAVSLLIGLVLIATPDKPEVKPVAVTRSTSQYVSKSVTPRSSHGKISNEIKDFSQ